MKPCPKCGESIPSEYNKHFKCGWDSNMGTINADISKILDILKNINSKLTAVEEKLGNYNGTLTSFNLNLLSIGKFLQERLKP